MEDFEEGSCKEETMPSRLENQNSEIERETLYIIVMEANHVHLAGPTFDRKHPSQRRDIER